ncbi:MAG: molybdate ABC transporter substrate-binding protein, partial [Chloroflexi bacterium]|nr:molybdate ABC transporter substrate-binding protein [Chloroflexota bacterium]
MHHRSSVPTWAAIIIVTTLFATILIGCSAPASAKVEPLTVSAAADLTPAFREIGEQFQQKTGIPVVFNFGSTGQATQQIMEGAPVDLFAAANIAYIDELNQAGLIIPDSITIYARGRITLWLPAESPLQIDEIADLADPTIKRIAIANP